MILSYLKSIAYAGVVLFLGCGVIYAFLFAVFGLKSCTDSTVRKDAGIEKTVAGLKV